jgi:hypothetical protein
MQRDEIICDSKYLKELNPSNKQNHPNFPTDVAKQIFFRGDFWCCALHLYDVTGPLADIGKIAHSRRCGLPSLNEWNHPDRGYTIQRRRRQINTQS